MSTYEKKMSSFRRLMAVVDDDGCPNRIPWSPELNQFFIERQLKERGIDPAKVTNSYVYMNNFIGADAICASGFFRKTYSPDILIRQEKDGNEIRDIIETPRGILIKKSRWDEDACTAFQVEPMLKNANDFRIYEYVVKNTKVETDYESLLELLATVGDEGIVTLSSPPTPFMDLLMNVQGPETAIYNLYDYSSEINKVMEAMMDLDRNIYHLAAGAPSLEIVRPYEDTSTMLTSPETFRKYCKPALREFADILHAEGKKFVPHMCGHLLDILKDLAEIGLDGVEAVTPPPLGNTTAMQMRKVTGKNFLVIGGIDPTRFSCYTLNQVSNMIREVLNEMRGDCKFILSCEEISVMAPMENVMIVSRIIQEEFSDFYQV